MNPDFALCRKVVICCFCQSMSPQVKPEASACPKSASPRNSMKFPLSSASAFNACPNVLDDSEEVLKGRSLAARLVGPDPVQIRRRRMRNQAIGQGHAKNLFHA
jgi:hypothetical protein